MNSFSLAIARFIRTLFGIDKPNLKHSFETGVNFGENKERARREATLLRCKEIEADMTVGRAVFHISNELTDPIIGILIKAEVSSKGTLYYIHDYITNQTTVSLSFHYLTNSLLEAILNADPRTRYMIYYNHHSMAWSPIGSAYKGDILLSPAQLRRKLTDNNFFTYLKKDCPDKSFKDIFFNN